MMYPPPRSTRSDTLLPYPTLFLFLLELDYRSTPHILVTASGMIANNGGRLGKTLWTEREAGEKVRVMGVLDGPEEARFVGDRIETHNPGGGRAAIGQAACRERGWSYG